MQYLVVMTSNTKPLQNESGWTTNGVNRKGRKYIILWFYCCKQTIII